MKQKEKKLLLKDLSSRLPYGVIVRHADYLVDSDGNYTGQFWYKRGYLYNICRLDNMTTTIIESEGSDEEGYEHICDLERSLPYLRSMNSMTEEEMEELLNIDKKRGLFSSRHLTWHIDGEIIDWLNKKMFDYRDLIRKGLALAAPDGMYE
jgi:hypothetical protein